MKAIIRSLATDVIDVLDKYAEESDASCDAINQILTRELENRRKKEIKIKQLIANNQKRKDSLRQEYQELKASLSTTE